jgi:hypothetical protein
MKKGWVRFSHGGLVDPDMFGYNTVDGIYYGQELRLNWKLDSVKVIRSRLGAGYAFHRHAPLISWDTDLLYAPMARGKVALYLNYTSEDFNPGNGIPALTNMFYTVLLRENHLKLYERIDATLYNRIDPVNGLVLNTSLTYGMVRQLADTSRFSIFYRNAPEERFTENTPGDRQVDAPELADHKKFLAEIKLEYTPRHYYVVRNHRKNMRDSKWPTFSLSYRQAIPMEQSGWSRFSTIEAGIRQRTKVGLMARLDWSLNAGFFADTASIHFSDYRHFKTNPLYLDKAGLEGALMLTEYYGTSTNEYWISLHGRITSSYLMLKYIPWFSERLWQESVSLAYLYTPGTSHYLQAGYSLEDIFFLMDLGVYVGFGQDPSEGTGRWGFRGVTGRINLNF